MENNKMRLSIVVPVYNVSKYLSKCIDSLLNQDLDPNEYEIIIVNDGSTDDSENIATRYVKRYSNILLINQENKGLGGARNSGIVASKGKYIQFVDSDDFLEKNVEKLLLDKMECEGLDVLRFNYTNVNERNEVFSPNMYGKRFVDYSDSPCNGMAFLNERLGSACYVWQFIFKSSLIKSQKLFEDHIFFEDVEWTPRVIISASHISSINRCVYYYLNREGSITNGDSIEKKRKTIEDKMYLISSMKKEMTKISDQRWFSGIIAESVISILWIVAVSFYSEREQYIDRLKELNVFPLSEYHLNKRASNKRLLINVSPRIFCFIYRRHYFRHKCGFFRR